MKVSVIVLTLLSLSQARAPHRRDVAHAAPSPETPSHSNDISTKFVKRQRVIPDLVSAALGGTSTQVLPSSTIAVKPGQPKTSIVVGPVPPVQASETSRDKLVTTGLLTNTARPSPPAPSIAREGPIPSPTLVPSLLSTPLLSSSSLPTDILNPSSLVNSTATRPSMTSSSTSTFTVTADAATMTSDPNNAVGVSTVVVQVTRAAPTPTLANRINAAGGRLSPASGVGLLSVVGLLMI